MKALITGGAGFIGSHLTEALIDKGDYVCVIDDFSTGLNENILHLQDYHNFSLVNGSLLDKELMDRIIDECDIVYHLAAAVGVKYIMENRIKSFKINVQGTENVLEAASKGNKKVMIASSSEVYGKNGKIPYKEDSDRVMGSTIYHRWSYSCTKALDEFLSLAYHKEKELPVIIMRFFNTVGPRQLGCYGMVLPRFVSFALNNKPLTIYGDGNQTRCFTFVGDAIRAIISLSQCEDAQGEIFNIGNNQEVSINHLANRIIEISGSSSLVQHIPYEQVYEEGFEDMRRRVPDISKIYEYIGWKPEYELDDIIRSMIASPVCV
ncbi:NAD-dependent epimerase/dehydratase family protein [Candidatus Poribacteria bacterium]|nr:NAD-dependent epimerase/dehydratase family protein [Candidatus Poribacteria bacterium]